MFRCPVIRAWGFGPSYGSPAPGASKPGRGRSRPRLFRRPPGRAIPDRVASWASPWVWYRWRACWPPLGPPGLMRAPRSGTRGRGKRLGRRPDGRRAARRPCHPQKPFVEQLLEPGLAASIGARELKRAAIEPNPNKLSAWSAPGRPPKGNGANLHNSFTWREAAALLRVSGRTVAHAARVLSEDSPAAPAGRLAVEQGRVTVSDASRVMDEPAEVQLRALERVTGGGSRNLAGAAQGLPPGGWIAEVGEVIGGAGPSSWRVWRTPARGVSPAGADMGEVRRRWCQVRSGCGGGKRGTGLPAPRATLDTSLWRS